jgi:hypothetical protein
VFHHLTHDEPLRAEEEGAGHHAHLAGLLVLAQLLQGPCHPTSMRAVNQLVGGCHQPGDQGERNGQVEGASAEGAGGGGEGGEAPPADEVTIAAAADVLAVGEPGVVLTDYAVEQGPVRGGA